MNRITMLLMGLLVFSSCSYDNIVGTGWNVLSRNKKITEKEFIQWWQDNKQDFIREQVISNLKYSLTYMPNELFYVRDKSSGSVDRPAWSDYEQDITFLLTIESLDSVAKGSLNSIYGLMDPVKLKYWQFEFGNDIDCITNGNKYPAALCHLEPGFNLTNKLTFIISFPIYHDLFGKEIKIEIDDNASNSGRFELMFDKSLIESIPGLI